MESSMNEEELPNKRIKFNLVELAEQACRRHHPDSDIEAALEFCHKVTPAFCKGASNDRLVKVGRRLRSLLDDFDSSRADDDTMVQPALELLVEECQILTPDDNTSLPFPQVPKVRFGKTELQMPIVSLGCMRFQQQWGDKVTKINQVYSDCQDNLVNVLRTALKHGINHIETARAYGSSELQLGVALKQLILAGECKREDWIIQTKVVIKEDPKEFRALLETSFRNLQVDYLDLFAFHGFNGNWQIPWLFGQDGKNCWNVIQEYRAAGKIRFVGFSTHGWTACISESIRTNKFDYVNLHHHFCGSYTASGQGTDGTGNLECLRLMKQRDMGAFVISIADKGGKIYAPSRKLRSLTLPDMEPITYGAAWAFNHHEMDAEGAPIHTFSVGAARPSDLDQFIVAAALQGKGKLLEKTKAVATRLERAKVDALGEDWVKSCYQGIIPSHISKYKIQHNQIVWLYNCIKAWGMLEFSRDRYKTFTGNSKRCKPGLSLDENIQSFLAQWGVMPGMAPEAGKDYFVDDLADVPEKNRERIKEAYEFVMKWCDPKEEAGKDDQELSPVVPKAWSCGFKMKPWKDFPDRPYP